MFLLAVHKFDTGDHPVLGELSMAFTRSFLLVLGLRRLLGTFNPMKKPSNYGGFMYRKLSEFLRFVTYCDFPQIDWREDFPKKPAMFRKKSLCSTCFGRFVLDVLGGWQGPASRRVWPQFPNAAGMECWWKVAPDVYRFSTVKVAKKIHAWWCFNLFLVQKNGVSRNSSTHPTCIQIQEVSQ